MLALSEHLKLTFKMCVDLELTCQNLPIRCFEMDVAKPLSMHLNTFRSLTEQKKIPDVAIHGFYKNLVPPTVRHQCVMQHDAGL